MREQRLTFLLAAILVVSGVILVSLRTKANLKAQLSPGESVWRITYEIVLPDTKIGTKLQAKFPKSTSQAIVFQEKILKGSLLLDIERNRQTQEREAVATTLWRSKKATFIAEFDVRLKPEKKPNLPVEKLSANTQAQYLQNEKNIQIKAPIIQSTLDILGKEEMPRQELVNVIFKYCVELIQRSDPDVEDAAATLEGKGGSVRGIARAMVALCRANQIPARLVTGFVIEESKDALSHTWVEVYDTGKWIPYDPKYSYSKEVPAMYLPISYNKTQFISVANSENWHKNISIQRLLPKPQSPWAQSKTLLAVADLTRMPVGMQHSLAILLLLPIGALLTIVFRNVIGFNTFGTFTPCLLALSFIYADWRTGIIAMVLVMIVGLITRDFLNRLKLLIIARLSIILGVVIVCMVITVSFLQYMGLAPSTQAVILPMVILTMLIERFYITAEEDGYRTAIKLLISTLIVSFGCYMVLQSKGLGRLFLTYPEALCFIFAAFLLFGRYTGYRFSEWFRFRDFAQKEIK